MSGYRSDVNKLDVEARDVAPTSEAELRDAPCNLRRPVSQAAQVARYQAISGA